MVVMVSQVAAGVLQQQLELEHLLLEMAVQVWLAAAEGRLYLILELAQVVMVEMLSVLMELFIQAGLEQLERVQTVLVVVEQE
jgi:hypothetical protein